ncbi:spore germination protein [Paenibacillus sp. FSL K6-3182]|uniref:spore germination protein n=2 Tax=Paenibacillus sp. FSL K6-3182 TaxID=2921495 RepID=UPI0030D300FB
MMSNPMSGNIQVRLKAIHEQMEFHSDVLVRECSIGDTGINAAIVFVNGLADCDLIDQHILRALMSVQGEGKTVSKSFLTNQILTVSQLSEVHSLEEMLPKVLMGATAVLVDGIDEIIIIGTARSKSRNIEEPISEALVRGPRAGFNENLSDNTAILRRHGENASLSFMSMYVGTRAKKQLIIAYIKDIADPELVEKVRRRVSKIDIDNLPESGYVEQLIEDNFLSPFPQVQSTERPDRVIGALMEGRVAILLDGTPFALIAPVTFSMLLQSPEDYYERWMVGTLLRMLRFLAALIALLTPAMYISFISFHPGLIPTKLAISIVGAREGVPFSSLVEALIMEVAIEILREAGLRLPKPIGPAMGIVGGLIIGEAAVRAGIVSPILVIVVALTAISSFAIPQYNAGIALRMLRFAAMFCAAAFGLYGVILFSLLLCAHVVKLKSFGVPYASPAVPYRVKDWKDFIVRMPIFMMKKRPEMLRPKDNTRTKN